MHIIIGKEIAGQVREKYIVVELETFPNGTAYCVLEMLAMNEMMDLERLLGLHQAVVDAWNRKDYSTVTFGIEHVYGKFEKQLDSFYDTLLGKIKELQVG